LKKKKNSIVRPTRSKCFRSCKILISLKLGLILLSSLPKSLSIAPCPNPSIVLKKKNYPFLLGSGLKSQVFYKMRSFLRSNNFQFTLKKKLNLRRQKVFFYSVHIAAPKKKNKKISLFGLKNIYYKKISLFFGFKKIAGFFKSCAYSKTLSGKNSFGVFLSLEGQLSNFIFRLNLFPSIYFVKKFIQFGNVFVNNKTVNYSSYIVNFNEIISFNRKY